jgi:hypothetical protein
MLPIHLDTANRGVAAQRDAEETVIHRLLEQFRTIKIPLSDDMTKDRGR